MSRTKRLSLGVAAMLLLAGTLAMGTAAGIVHGASSGAITTPANVQVVSTGPQSITLSWSASTNNSGSGDVPAYYVYNGSNIVGTSDGTSVTISSLLPSTSYTFTVQAYDFAGNTSSMSSSVSATTQASTSQYLKVAYFDQWGIYVNAYDVANVDTTGVASKINTLIYAFENIDPTNLTCFEAVKQSDPDPAGENDPNAGDGAEDAYADYQDTNVGSVDGTATNYSQPLKGNFNQLRELKAKYPNIKVILSLGGWTYSKYFSDVAATQASRQKFVSSCIDMFIKGNLPTGVAGDSGSGGPEAAAGIFDGFDIDWEYPGAAGHLGNHYGPQDTQNYTLLLQEFRSELDSYGQSIGKHFELTAALPSGQDKISLIQTNQVCQSLDFGDVMTYDMHGAWDATGPTNFQDPIYSLPNDPMAPVPPGNEKYNIDTAMKAWTTGLPDYNIPGGCPASKLTVGFPFYYRGWTGVSAGSDHGLFQAATGAAAGSSDSGNVPGIQFYKELNGVVNNPADTYYDANAQAAWFYDGTNFWGGDSPQSIAAKDAYIKANGYAGAMMFSLEDEDSGTTLLNAVVNGLSGSPCGSACPTPTPMPTPTTGPSPTATATPSSTATPGVTPTPPSSGNLVSNPGFETGDLTGWTCDAGTAAVVSSPVHSGNHALQLNPNSSDDAQCTQTISVQPNTAYTLLAYMQGNYAYLGVTSQSSTWGNESSYTQLSYAFTTGASTTSVTIYVHGWYGQGSVYVDDVALIGPGGSGNPTPTPTTSPNPTPTPTKTPPTPTPTNAPPTPTPGSTPTPTPPSSGNLVSNPGFETGSLSGWTCDAGTAAVVSSPVHSGSHALQLNPTSSDDAQCTQTISVQPNHSYTLSASVEGNYAYIGVTNGGSCSTWTSASSYTLLSCSFTTGASTSSVTIYVHGWYSQGAVYADDFSLQ